MIKRRLSDERTKEIASQLDFNELDFNERRYLARDNLDANASIAELVEVAEEYADMISRSPELWDFKAHKRILAIITKYKAAP